MMKYNIFKKAFKTLSSHIFIIPSLLFSSGHILLANEIESIQNINSEDLILKEYMEVFMMIP